ncbi:uncharacterized protein EV422DRAFT_166242 [Fimicolochytrium jonesii]|uniref:uncharacterized protein n=1 Tax=Fimicolochytrium jonesii TaxID=1396493 RepID=UPI0022FEA533|nr:uncharacterized protein EV422DRAFT_166242 [Fimicolochytrium jonesii]KAI8818815.1 hypothetical protein EV422DRAFT_166242 [Fimicolochytrium jonesii]
MFRVRRPWRRTSRGPTRLVVLTPLLATLCILLAAGEALSQSTTASSLPPLLPTQNSNSSLFATATPTFSNHVFTAGTSRASAVPTASPYPADGKIPCTPPNGTECAMAHCSTCDFKHEFHCMEVYDAGVNEVHHKCVVVAVAVGGGEAVSGDDGVSEADHDWTGVVVLFTVIPLVGLILICCGAAWCDRWIKRRKRAKKLLASQAGGGSASQKTFVGLP